MQIGEGSMIFMQEKKGGKFMHAYWGALLCKGWLKGGGGQQKMCFTKGKVRRI